MKINRSRYLPTAMRVAFPASVGRPGPVKVMRPNPEGVLVEVEPTEVHDPKPLPTHAEMNAVRFS